jgi:hypothetical protein
MIRLPLFSALFLLGVCSWGVKAEEVLFQDDFSGDLSRWVVEQTPSGKTQILDGELDIDDAPGPKDKGGCTVWFKEKISGPVRITYEATMVQKGGPNDRISDLNCFWMASDPKHPDDLFVESKARGGIFKTYDPLRTYYVGYGANENVTTRFRRYPRARDDKGLKPEFDLSEGKFMNVGNQTVKIDLVANGGKVQFSRDGELIFTFEDPDPLREGWFGFRTTRSHIRFDNFKVTRISAQGEKK